MGISIIKPAEINFQRNVFKRTQANTVPVNIPSLSFTGKDTVSFGNITFKAASKETMSEFIKDISKLTESKDQLRMWNEFESLTKVERRYEPKYLHPLKKEPLPGNPAAELISNHLRDRLVEMGFEVRQVGVGTFKKVHRDVLDFVECAKEAPLGEKDLPTKYNIIALRNIGFDAEKRNALILQAHMDMVNESKHDRQHEPIQLTVENAANPETAIVKAKNQRTCGSDNGVGMSAVLALCNQDKFKNLPLQVIFTVNEETTGSGAESITAADLYGNYLINTDNEYEDKVIIGCAGVDKYVFNDYNYPKTTMNTKDYDKVAVSIKETSGGHSGVRIHSGTLNPIRHILSEFNNIELSDNSKLKDNIHITSIEGGKMANSIPSDVTVEMFVPKSKTAEVIKTLSERLEKTKQEQQKLTFKECGKEEKIDQDMKTSVQKVDNPGVNQIETLEKGFQDRLIEVVGTELFNGIYDKYKDQYQDVLASQNTGQLVVKDGKLTLQVCGRSSEAPQEKELMNKTLTSLHKLFPDEQIKPRISPPWMPDWASEFNKKVLELAKKYVNPDSRFQVIHGGLETAYFALAKPGLKSVSVGPNIGNAHSEDEYTSVKSVNNFYNFLTNVVDEVKNKLNE